VEWCADCAAGNDVYPDNDEHLGSCQCGCHVLRPSGYDLVKWMGETGNWPRQKPLVHSMNPVGAAAMRTYIDRYWTPRSS
jgi:hypothetical protein